MSDEKPTVDRIAFRATPAREIGEQLRRERGHSGGYDPVLMTGIPTQALQQMDTVVDVLKDVVATMEYQQKALQQIAELLQKHLEMLERIADLAWDLNQK